MINNRVSRILLLVLVFTILFSLPSYAKKDDEDEGVMSHINEPGLNESLKDLKETSERITSYIVAFTLIISVAVLMVHFFRLATAYNHPLHRRKVIKDIIAVFIAVSILGSLGLIMRVIASFFM